MATDPLKIRSAEMTDGPSRAAARAMFKAIGVSAACQEAIAQVRQIASASETLIRQSEALISTSITKAEKSFFITVCVIIGTVVLIACACMTAAVNLSISIDNLSDQRVADHVSFVKIYKSNAFCLT